jgi:hypothetical protein
MATNELSSIWGRSSWPRPPVMTSSWRHLIVGAWVTADERPDRGEKWKADDKGAQHGPIIAAYTSKFDPRYLGPGLSDRHEFSPRSSPRWENLPCEVWSLSNERKTFYAREYFVIYGIYSFSGSRHGTAPWNFWVSDPSRSQTPWAIWVKWTSDQRFVVESTCQISSP